MFRLTKQTDYAILLMAYMANNPQRLLFTARELADETRIPAPMVTKILKVLSSREMLLSHRGAHGGYRLSRLPGEIPVLEIIDALEGPVSLTACSEDGVDGACDLEPSCQVRGIWQTLSARVRDALGGVSMADMARAANCGPADDEEVDEIAADQGGEKLTNETTDSARREIAAAPVIANAGEAR